MVDVSAPCMCISICKGEFQKHRATCFISTSNRYSGRVLHRSDENIGRLGVIDADLAWHRMAGASAARSYFSAQQLFHSRIPVILVECVANAVCPSQWPA